MLTHSEPSTFALTSALAKISTVDFSIVTRAVDVLRTVSCCLGLCVLHPPSAALHVLEISKFRVAHRLFKYMRLGDEVAYTEYRMWHSKGFALGLGR